MTYSRMRMHTTIGAAAFHFRVRNGIGWFHSAMVTRERVEVAVLGGRARSRWLPGQLPAWRMGGRSESSWIATNVDVSSRLSLAVPSGSGQVDLR